MSLVSSVFKFLSAGVTAGVIYWLGGWDMILQILVTMIIIDYVSGVLSSAIQGKISSKIAYKGINRKLYMLILVGVAVQLDRITGSTGLVRGATCSFYISMELMSVIENAGRAGLQVPKVLVKAVEIFKDQTEQG